MSSAVAPDSTPSSVESPGPHPSEMTTNGLVMNETSGGSGREVVLSGPFEVLGASRMIDGCGWGKLLAWNDQDGRRQQVHVFDRDLLTDENASLRALVDRGLQITPRYKRDLARALISLQPAGRVVLAQRNGWLNGVYVLGEEAFGAKSSETIHNISVGDSGACAGTADEWRKRVAEPAIGNSRLILALCAAFAAPMLRQVETDGFGVHFSGESSTGKSSCLALAASVWGRSVTTWRATGNGLEALAVNANDSLLCLDELGEIDGREVGGVVYMLANGSPKARATRDGGARQRQDFRVLVLSTGEIGIQDKLQEEGRGVRLQRAGQAVRFLDVPADAGAEMGVLEDAHDVEPAAFVDNLKAACAEVHGVAGRRFLTEFVKDREGAIASFEKRRRAFLSAHSGASSQSHRALKHFAVLAASGELATEFGITGWPLGEAQASLARCFQAWDHLHGGPIVLEDRQAISLVRSYLGEHGQSRFSPDSDMSGSPLRPTHNRTGFRKAVNGIQGCYCVPVDLWPRIVEGIDAKRAVDALYRHGHLVTERGRKTANVRNEEKATERVYAIRATILVDENSSSTHLKLAQ